MFPEVRTPIPGPASQALLARLAQVESPNVTAPEGALGWARAEGVNVWDVDGNRYLDLTAAFAVAAIGHRHPAQLAAIEAQCGQLIHGMGDVHPNESKVALLEALAAIAPGDLSLGILGCNGSDAIEAALKTAVLRTGKPGVIHFAGSYHGLSYGALALCGREEFRAPFAAQLNPCVRTVPYPDPYRLPRDIDDVSTLVTDCLAAVAVTMLDLDAQGVACGAIVVEAIQGRGGEVVPPAGFLPGLRELADAFGALLIVDEIYTGFGRTGQMFACEHEGIEPDLLCLGKGLTSGFPLSVCLGTPAAMAGWPPSRGEALHTYTYLGHPLGCAMGLASLQIIRDENLVERAATLGAAFGAQLTALADRQTAIGDVRGRGLMWGVDLVSDRVARTPDPRLAGRVIRRLQEKGILLLPSGAAGNVLAFAPPLVITAEELEFAVAALDATLAEVG